MIRFRLQKTIISFLKPKSILPFKFIQIEPNDLIQAVLLLLL